MGAIGVAGCGTMGRPMLQALLDAGFDARGFDIRPVDHPAVTTDFAGFADGLETCLTVVRDEHETERLLFTDQGLGAVPGLTTLVICSTLPPSYVRGLAPRLPHLDLVDAPMSGAEVGAINRTLSFMPGGRPETVERLMPLFRAMGRSIHPMGPYGMGILTKVLNNLVLSACVTATRTALDWADAHGLPEEALLDLMEASTGQNWFASGRDRIEFFRHGFAPGNTIEILEKDVRCALDAAPEGADRTLAEDVRATLRALGPRAAPEA